MTSFLEKLIIQLWNTMTVRQVDDQVAPGLNIGREVVEEQLTARRVSIPSGRRCEHVVMLGKTGQGKSRLLHYMVRQDLSDQRGFAFFDLHGDTTPVVLAMAADLERRTGADLSRRLIVIDPADREHAVGINLLERPAGQDVHVMIAEFAQILKNRWHLDGLGARTEELLRNALFVLAACGLTIVDIAPLLTNPAFRAECLAQTTNGEVVGYFADRFNAQSEAMQAAMRDPILNKVSGFSFDEKVRHVVGQRRSTFSLTDAMDRGYFILMNFNKGTLGEQAGLFAALLLARIKHALFARTNRQIFTLYCDEVQNLVSSEAALETLFSEARKFGVSVTSANQYAEQYPAATRAAMAAVGTHIYFQLSAQDAERVATSLDGGKRLSETLKNLPKRNVIVKSGSERYRQAVVPTVESPRADWLDLYNRSRQRWARRRVEIEHEIRQRQPQRQQRPERGLDGWE